MSKQIGWYHQKEDKVFYNTFECAAWYEEVLCKAGKYPVFVSEHKVIKHEDPEYNNKLGDHWAYITLQGTILSDEFGARFCGMPIGGYDNKKNAGKESSHTLMPYLYDIAESVLEDPESPYELFPEYEAREIHGEWNGEPYTTHGIYYSV